jgi:hypothetical protein
MIQLEKRMNAFVILGKILRDTGTIGHKSGNTSIPKLINESVLSNPWFTPDNVRSAILNIGESLTQENLAHWLNRYSRMLIERPERRVGVVMAGNIPLVGFHDLLCVLVSGHKILARLSSDDRHLMPVIASILIEIEPEFADQIIFNEGKLTNFNAVIATGSNNTSRYFEYYFRDVPHIIRRNRNGVAVLTGKESVDELRLLGQDIFIYFGLGCRSISKVFVPKSFSFKDFFKAIDTYKYVSDHNKYINNYEYYKSIYLINSVNHFDNGFLLMKEDIGFASPPAVLYYEEYEDLNILNNRLGLAKNEIQCIVGPQKNVTGAISFGRAQMPDLWDYADGVDTMEFLLNL